MPEYTHKPKGPPTLDMLSVTTRLQANQAITPKLAAQLIEWKQWVESTDNWDGVAAGGIRDILNSVCIGVDKLKLTVDALSQGQLELRADVQALQEAPAAHPFP
jgi:hypothetical protein